MSNLTAFRLTSGLYGLFLGIWIGAIVMLAIGAAVIFRTVREHKPTIGIEPYNAPLPGEPDRHATILAGSIVGNTIKALDVIQIVCAAVVLVCIVLQCIFFADRIGPVSHWMNLLRILLVVLPLVILVSSKVVINPNVHQKRLVMDDVQQSEQVRQAARAQFNRYHALSERLLAAAGIMLIIAALVSPFVLYQDPEALSAAVSSNRGPTSH